MKKQTHTEEAGQTEPRRRATNGEMIKEAFTGVVNCIRQGIRFAEKIEEAMKILREDGRDIILDRRNVPPADIAYYLAYLTLSEDGAWERSVEDSQFYKAIGSDMTDEEIAEKLINILRKRILNPDEEAEDESI